MGDYRVHHRFRLADDIDVGEVRNQDVVEALILANKYFSHSVRLAILSNRLPPAYHAPGTLTCYPGLEALLYEFFEKYGRWH